MAWLEKRGDGYHIYFRQAGQRFSRSLKTASLKRAETLLSRLEENLADVERGRLVIPQGADTITFLLSDGAIEQPVQLQKALSLGAFLERYQKEVPAGSKEGNTRYTEDIHIAHLRRIIGDKTPVGAVTTATLQGYVNERAKGTGRNKRPVSPATIRKEIGTLTSIWNRWALPLGLVPGIAPTRNIMYEKGRA